MPIIQREDAPLFHLLSSLRKSLLSPGRLLRTTTPSIDYHLGYLDVLRVLTTVGDISYDQWIERYNWMARRNDEYI